ncbi:related to EDE1 [Lecanosticta acicola]|uniref:Related to EDE1 n=1 Tax=Lecanosticta acicola TaxID=111012 RepID=A0AAI8YXB7_9PEZI|nr:related to EDE1 [Lecanosticta acicola]
MSDADPAILNLSPDEKRAFSFLFAQADKDQLGVVTGENAVTFFERTRVSPNVLGEIWQIADTENRGLLTKPGFSMVLRLIGHYQAGREPSAELAFKPAPIPKFEGLQIPGIGANIPAGGSNVPSPTAAGFPPNALQPQLSGQAPIRVPPLDPAKVQQYSGLFERSSTQNGLLDGASAKAIFERAGLPNEVLGRIWNLADREQKGALDQTEFIIAMHLLTSMKTRAMSALPNALPPGLYDAAARRGAPPSRQGTGPAVVARQVTGTSAGPMPRAQSPLARPPGYGTPPPLSAQTSGTPWLITPTDKAKFDRHFTTIDPQGRGVITGEQAVSFFSDSRLPEETLAQIWDLADINSEGQLNKDEFAVAMYLIRQQRAPNPPPLPAFLPPALVPPSMRKQTQQTQSTAPAFDNANNTSNLPKSAADDLFGLDQPLPPQAQPQVSVLQPQGTGASAPRDPFAGSSPGSPNSPARFQPPQGGSHFKPFMPTSAFGASLASQNTGGSMGSNQAAPAARSFPQQQPPSASDDLLGDNETHAEESSKITNETTELANMSSQIGNLRSQMEQTQSKKSATQADLDATNNQKRDLEQRLQQFRTQYEQEVRTVKEVEQQLAASRESAKKLNQDLAMLEGTYQDLQTQHQNIAQALQADQQENATLKQRISRINAEVAQLKPEIEKLKLDARQQKGLVSINKKQLTTNEGERDRLQSEKADLEREASERSEQPQSVESVTSPAPTSNLASPSGLSSTNPFFRKASNEGPAERSTSPPAQSGSSSGPTPSAFDNLFGPSAAFAPSGQAGSRTGTPPATSFVARSMASASAGPAHGMTDSIQSISSTGEHTPSATPPLSDQNKDSPAIAEPPPPPESRQFTASHLPVVDVTNKDGQQDSDASSTKVIPPASSSGFEMPRDTSSVAGGSTYHQVPTEPDAAAKEHVPGAFPIEPWPPASSTGEQSLPQTETETGEASSKDDFNSAFAGFDDGDKAKEPVNENKDPFAPSSRNVLQPSGSEFPPIQSLELEDESDSEDEAGKGFEDDFTAASPPRTQATRDMPGSAAAGSILTAGLPAADSQRSPPAYQDSEKPSHGGRGERTEENQFPPEFGGLLPAREDPTSHPLPEEAPIGTATASTTEINSESAGEAATPAASHSAAPKNAFDDFDAFDNLAEAKEADKSGTDFDFGSLEQSTEFNSAFDSPAASTTNTMTSSQQTPVAAARTLHQPDSNGFANFQPSASTSSAFDGGSGSIQQTPQNVQHDWDAIFSGLDNSKNLDTSLSNDPWGTAPTNGGSATTSQTLAAPAAPKKPNLPDRGGAITPGTEHDDPILKRLTGMGYPRGQALAALEEYDYDINRAVDHLTSN